MTLGELLRLLSFSKCQLRLATKEFFDGVFIFLANRKITLSIWMSNVKGIP